MLPKARSVGLVVTELDDEVVVYDEKTSRAHMLNGSAAMVWRHADGSRSVQAIAELLEREYGIADGSELVGLAVEELRLAGLLETPLAVVPRHLTRRDVVKRMAAVGVAAGLVPVVMSMTAPTPAMAASGPGGPPPPPPACTCPTCAAALLLPVVSNAVDAAWTASNAGNAANRHEEGGWVIQTATAPCTVRAPRVAAGERAGLTPGADPSGANEHACGFYHTHPNPPVDERGRRWVQGPSDADVAWHNARGLWGIIRNAAGNQCF